MHDAFNEFALRLKLPSVGMLRVHIHAQLSSPSCDPSHNYVANGFVWKVGYPIVGNWCSLCNCFPQWQPILGAPKLLLDQKNNYQKLEDLTTYLNFILKSPEIPMVDSEISHFPMCLAAWLAPWWSSPPPRCCIPGSTAEFTTEIIQSSTPKWGFQPLNIAHYSTNHRIEDDFTIIPNPMIGDIFNNHIQ